MAGERLKGKTSRECRLSPPQLGPSPAHHGGLRVPAPACTGLGAQAGLVATHTPPTRLVGLHLVPKLQGVSKSKGAPSQQRRPPSPAVGRPVLHSGGLDRPSELWPVAHPGPQRAPAPPHRPSGWFRELGGPGDEGQWDRQRMGVRKAWRGPADWLAGVRQQGSGPLRPGRRAASAAKCWERWPQVWKCSG